MVNPEMNSGLLNPGAPSGQKVCSGRHTTPPRRTFAAFVASISLFVAGSACSKDDGASVRNLGSEDSSASDSGSSASSGSESGSASAPADEPAACSPVNSDLEPQATQTVDVALTDYKFDKEQYEVAAGIVTFKATNDGSVNHEIAFLPAGAEVPYADGAPDEDALEAAGAFELEAFGPGLTCNATYDLAPGEYTLFCIVAIDDTHNHYDEGMKSKLIVTA